MFRYGSLVVFRPFISIQILNLSAQRVAVMMEFEKEIFIASTIILKQSTILIVTQISPQLLSLAIVTSVLNG